MIVDPFERATVGLTKNALITFPQISRFAFGMGSLLFDLGRPRNPLSVPSKSVAVRADRGHMGASDGAALAPREIPPGFSPVAITASDVAFGGVELSPIRKKTGPRNKVHF